MEENETNQLREQARTAILQSAAKKAKAGETDLAKAIRRYIEEKAGEAYGSAAEYRRIQEMAPKSCLADLKGEPEEEQISRFLWEYRNRKKLESLGLRCRRKILLCGDPPFGRDAIPQILADELGVPLFYTPETDVPGCRFSDFSKVMDEMFRQMETVRGVYMLADEDITQGGRSRALKLAKLLNLLEEDRSESILVLSVSGKSELSERNLELFDDIIRFEVPGQKDVRRFLQEELEGEEDDSLFSWDILNAMSGLSREAVHQICNNAVKAAIRKERTISERDILAAAAEWRADR